MPTRATALGHSVTNQRRHEVPYDVAVNPVNGPFPFVDIDAGKPWTFKERA